MSLVGAQTLFLREVARGLAAEYIRRDRGPFNGLMFRSKRYFKNSTNITDVKRHMKLEMLLHTFPDIADFALADSLTFNTPPFRCSDLKTEEIDGRFIDIMHYLFRQPYALVGEGER